MKALLTSQIKKLLIYAILVVLVGSLVYFSALFYGQKPLHVAKKQWNPAEASEQGLDPGRLKQASDYVENRLPLARGLIIIKNGKTVLEKYYWKGGPQEKEYLHSLNTIVLHALIGIAIENKELADVRQPLADFFPGSLQGVGQDVKKMTVEDLLRVKEELIWGDKIPKYWQLFYAYDKVSASLGALRSVKDNPQSAARFAANFLLAKIIEKATSLSIFEYANIHLFKPLGITTYEQMDEQGEYRDAFLGFRLKTLDLAKLGYLVLHQGRWQGTQLISQKWLENMESLNNDSLRFLGVWPVEMFNNFKIVKAKGEGGQFVIFSPELDIVIAISSESLFPLSLISGYDTLIKLIMNSVNEASDPQESAGLYSDSEKHAYYEPNFIVTTPVPEDIHAFIIRFSKDIATNDIHKIAYHYAKGYWSDYDGFRSVYQFWGKIFNGGSGDLESVHIRKIRVDNNRAYLRGSFKLSYMNMNEGSFGWFELENLIRLNGRWLWLGSPDYGDILDRDDYFDAEIPDSLQEFMKRCVRSFPASYVQKGKGCYSENFNFHGLTQAQLQEYLQPLTAKKDGKVHLTKVEKLGADWLVEGYVKNSLIGDLSLPPFMRIVQKNGQWRWSGNEAD